MTADLGYNRKGALQRLREGLVCVMHAERLGGERTRPTVVIARVASSREGAHPHRVDLMNSRWDCSCGARTCPHRAAVQMVTGYDPAVAA